MATSVTTRFSIDVSWLQRSYGPGEIRETAASLQIAAGGKIATRMEDGWSKSVQLSARVSAYPLVLWLASSWWRLRWESSPFRTTPDVSWRMAHEMPAAGYGFLWPLVTFESDGEQIVIQSRPSDLLSDEPVKYLSAFREAVSASEFERTIDQFIEFVIARLDAVGIESSELHELWSDVRKERGDAALSFTRTLEAQLGFEPEEAPSDLLVRLDDLSHQVGRAAIAELAPVCAGDLPEKTLTEIEQFSSMPGPEAHISIPCLSEARISIARLSNERLSHSEVPWKRGWRLATELRTACKLGLHAISDQALADMLEIPVGTLQKSNVTPHRLPLGLAIRNGRQDRLKLLFRKRNRPGLRFEAARFLAESILWSADEAWLPTTDTHTARQKVQRAFAAEFLCPIHALMDFLNGDLSPEAN